MESLLYLYGLQKAAELAEFAGRTDTAADTGSGQEHFRMQSVPIALGSIQGTTLIQDGPGIEEYSVHCQVFAVLTGIVEPAEGKQMLEAVVGKPEVPQASVAFIFTCSARWNAAAGTKETDDLWEIWRQMVENHLTTCVENSTDTSSDCHAWGGIALL